MRAHAIQLTKKKAEETKQSNLTGIISTVAISPREFARSSGKLFEMRIGMFVGDANT